MLTQLVETFLQDLFSNSEVDASELFGDLEKTFPCGTQCMIMSFACGNYSLPYYSLPYY